MRFESTEERQARIERIKEAPTAYSGTQQGPRGAFLTKQRHTKKDPSHDCVFHVRCYADTPCEVTCRVEIYEEEGGIKQALTGEVLEEFCSYGYDISTDREGTLGMRSSGHKSRHEAMAAAMLRVASYGNGGFPLDNGYLRRER